MAHTEQASRKRLRLAIVIPTLNEENVLEDQLDEVLGVAELVIVADGGSSDRTSAIARGRGVMLRQCEPGRGPQLNCGAEAAIGEGADVLLFLHADTRLPANARRAIAEALASGSTGGGFSVRFDDPRFRFRLGAAIVNLRTRLLAMPLGDQAQFVTATTFTEMGGFRDWPILEDLDFVHRLRRKGRVAVLSPPVTTAARRFLEGRSARTIAKNWLIWLLYALGVAPRRLARLYPHDQK